jgi:hypothetical protein
MRLDETKGSDPEGSPLTEVSMPHIPFTSVRLLLTWPGTFQVIAYTEMP